MSSRNIIPVLLLIFICTTSFASPEQGSAWIDHYSHGNGLFYSGMLEEAYKALQEARYLNPDEPLINWRMAQLLFVQEKRLLENTRVRNLNEEKSANPRSGNKLSDYDSVYFDIDDPDHFTKFNIFLDLLNDGRRLAKERRQHNSSLIQGQSEFLLGAFDGMEALYLGLIFNEKWQAYSTTISMLERLRPIISRRDSCWGDALVYIAGTNIGTGKTAGFFQRRGLSILGIPHSLNDGFPWMLEAVENEQLSQDASLAFIVAVANIDKGNFESRYGERALEITQALKAHYPDNPSLWLEEIRLLLILDRNTQAESVRSEALSKFEFDPRKLDGKLDNVLYRIEHIIENN